MSTKYKTPEQQIVVTKKLNDGYKMIGLSVSSLNGLSLFVLTKGKHTLAVNSLGYDEHVFGKTYKLKEVYE